MYFLWIVLNHPEPLLLSELSIVTLHTHNTLDCILSYCKLCDMYITFRLARVRDRERDERSPDRVLAWQHPSNPISWRDVFSTSPPGEAKRGRGAHWLSGVERKSDARSPLQLGSALVYLPERIISLVVYGISSIQLGHPQDVQPFLNWLVARTELNTVAESSRATHIYLDGFPTSGSSLAIQSGVCRESEIIIRTGSTIHNLLNCFLHRLHLWKRHHIHHHQPPQLVESRRATANWWRGRDQPIRGTTLPTTTTATQLHY